jgi:hypothetical protein
MFDNLREEAEASPFYEEEESTKFQPAAVTGSFFAPASSRRILGMTGVQRFVVVFMLFLAVCLVGGMALLVMDKIGF